MTTATPGLERDYAKIVAGLRERAGHARSEKTATALADALYFEEAAESIEALLATPAPAGGEVRALREAARGVLKARDDWNARQEKPEFLAFSKALDALETALSVQEPAPSPAVVVDEAMVERLTAEIAEARRRLAAWDINALPNDMSLLDIVDARIADLQKYMNGDDLPFRKRDIERGLILFRTSNNAHGLTNFVSLTTKVEALPQSGKDELASMMRNMAEQLSPALTESQNAGGEQPAPKVDWTVSDSETAREIMSYLGIASDASLEPSADRRRDKVASMIRARIDATPAPNGVSGAVREALEPFAKLADEIDALNHEEHSTCLHRIAATDLRRAKTVLASLPPAEAAQAGEAIKGDAAYDAYMQWANGDEENTVFAELRTVLPSLNDIQAGQVVIAVARALANLPTPSREEVPTDEQMERAARALATLHYTKRFAKPPYDGHVRTNVDGNWHTYSDEARAALKAAGPSAQQRVSEEMVERARKNLAASGIWVSAHGVMQVLEAALSPENGGA